MSKRTKLLMLLLLPSVAPYGFVWGQTTESSTTSIAWMLLVDLPIAWMRVLLWMGRWLVQLLTILAPCTAILLSVTMATQWLEHCWLVFAKRNGVFGSCASMQQLRNSFYKWYWSLVTLLLSCDFLYLLIVTANDMNDPQSQQTSLLLNNQSPRSGLPHDQQHLLAKPSAAASLGVSRRSHGLVLLGGWISLMLVVACVIKYPWRDALKRWSNPFETMVQGISARF